jgi:hypothetical protein
MTEKSAVTPSAKSVQTKKKTPLDLAMLPPAPTTKRSARTDPCELGD